MKELLNPINILKLLYKINYLQFFAVGVTGVLINLTIVYTLTEFIFGLENYYTAYLIGLTVNLLYNFLAHTIITFQTKKHHKTRFTYFVIYSLALSGLQAITVRYLTPIIGLEYYLFTIASIIFIFSTVTFVFFKLVLFNEKKFLKK